MKSNKQFAIIVLWTVIAVIIALFLFLRRERGSKPNVTPGPSRTVSRPAIATVEQKTEKFVLVTLNNTLISEETLELIPENVTIFRKLAEACSARSAGLIVLFTVPDDMLNESESEVPENVKRTIETRLEEGGIFASGLKRHRLVFTKSVEGRISVGRQVEAYLFIDSDRQVVEELTGKVPNVVCLDSTSFKKFIATNEFFSNNE